MKRSWILVLSLIITVGPPQALAQKTLSWQSSVEQAIQNNPELLAAQSTWASAKADAQGAYSGFFPQVTGALGYTYGNSASQPGDGNLNYTASLSASENLFSGFQDTAKVNQAQAATEVAAADLQTTKALVSYELKSAYVGVVYAQNLVKLTADIIKRREYNLRLVQLRFENGGENKGSVLLSKAYLEQAKLDHLQAENDVSLSQVQLKKVLGMATTDPDLQVSDDVPLQSPTVIENWQTLALQTPDYLKSVAQSESARAGVTLARSAFFPSLNLTGSTGKSGPEWFPERDRWSVGLSLSIPLFNGGRDYFGQKSASETYRAAEYRRSQTSGDSVEKVKTAYTTYIESVQKLEVDRSFSEAASVRQKIGREKYNNGLLSFDNWDIIESDLITRQKAFLGSQKARTVDEAAWEQAQGKGVIP